jgi:hypothetical protein
VVVRRIESRFSFWGKSSGEPGKALKRVSGTPLEGRSVEAVNLPSKSVISTVCIDVGEEPVEDVKEFGRPVRRVELIETEEQNLKFVSTNAPLNEKTQEYSVERYGRHPR